MPHWELEDLPDPTEARRWAKAGVVPIGTPVLHSLAVAVPEIDPNLRELAARMLRVMKRCHGIGLAANQVGVPVRMFVHSFDKVLPPVIVNPVIVKSFGKSEDSEGCLSLQVEGSRAAVTRPKVVMTWGTLLNGRRIFVCADELVSRVFQHEIDHLDGLEYVQRLTDREQHRVYETLRANGIDLRWIPPRPY